MNQHFPQPRASAPSIPFRKHPLSAIAACLLAVSPVHAQEGDPSVAALQAEIAKLKAALAEQQRQAVAPADAAASASSTVVASASASNEDAPASDQVASLDSVVVHSRNRIERLQDVPLSISVVTGKELDRLQANDIGSIIQRAGNISWNYGNQRTSSLSIRGIAKQSQTEAQDPSVGIIVDGVSYAYNPLISSYYFADVDSVEVTRGPQGTLLGKNSSIGAVNITTRQPSFTPSADYTLLYGQNRHLTATLAAGGPVIDDLLAWRGTFVVDRANGDLHDPYNDSATYSNINRMAGRVQFLLTPTPDFSARVSAEIKPRADEHTNSAVINTPTPTVYSNGTVNPLTTDAATRLARSWFTQNPNYTYAKDYLYGGRDGASVDNDEARGVVTGGRGASATLDWKVGDYSLTSITAYEDYFFNAVNDDGTPFDIQRNSGGFYINYKQVSQELRVSSKVGGFVDYQGGLYFLKVHNNSEYRRSFGNDGGAWFASNAQYKALDADGAGRYLMQNSLDGLDQAFNSPAGDQIIDNRSRAIFAQANWHPADRLTVTTGARLTQENRQNLGSSYLRSNGFGGELNPVAVNGVQLGGFASAADGTIDGSTNSLAQLQLADQVAAKYFGVAATSTAGVAYDSLTATQKQQVAYAKAIRLSNIGVLFSPRQAEPFKKVQPSLVLSPSYKLSDDITTYLALQYGEKAGIAQFVNGLSDKVDAEKTSSYELGVKSALLDKTLILNADLFLTNIKNYQQSVQVYDAYTTQSKNDGTRYYTSATGNVPKVQARGLEVDGVYAGIPRTTLRFSGAYNDAFYKLFPNSAQPVENGYAGSSPYRDVTGRTLPGASKYTFNVGGDYRQPVWTGSVFHVDFNTAYNSGFNSDTALSDYGWVKGKSVTDLSIGLGRADSTFDVSLLAKNVFDDKTPWARTWNSYTPAPRRWFGIMFTGKH